MDTEAFGHDRTALITRLPAFTDQLRVAEDRNGLLGYAAVWPDGATHTVGPLIARDSDTAKALVVSLASGTDRPLRIDVDEHHGELCDWLRTHGLVTVAHRTVMTCNAPGLPGNSHRRFAPLSTATG
jgi:hypothetical protein